MNRLGLAVALCVSAAVGTAFGLYPKLDLAIAGWFFNPDQTDHELRQILMVARNTAMWLIAALLVPAGGALLLKLLLPRSRLLVSGRAILFLSLTMLLGPGLLVNVVLKEHWGRSRPIDVVELRGGERFVAWWDPRGECTSNCSFVSGDVSGAAWTLAPAALAPPAWRAFAYAGALTFTGAVATQRMIFGAHFLTDVVFATVFSFLIIWLMHGLIYRWPRTRLSDKAIESTIERLAMPGYEFISGLFGRKKPEDRKPL